MTRREHLELLLTRVQRELAAEQAREARMAAARARVEACIPEDEEQDVPTTRSLCRGRHAIPDAYTTDQAREAHAMFVAGNRDAWVVDAERQYQRNRKRASRERLAS